MAPIHDTDLAENRWSQSEWNHYELWEKKEARNRRNRRIWMGATALLFFLLGAIPVIRVSRPEWKLKALGWAVAREIGAIRNRALTEKKAYAVKLTETFVEGMSSELKWVTGVGPHCESAMAALSTVTDHLGRAGQPMNGYHFIFSGKSWCIDGSEASSHKFQPLLWNIKIDKLLTDPNDVIYSPIEISLPNLEGNIVVKSIGFAH